MMTTLRRASRLASALALASLAACGGDKVTGTETAKLKTGSLLVTTSGLPNGISANLKLEKAQTSLTVASGSVQSAIETGNYTLVATAVTADGLTYDPQPASQAVTITNNKQTSTSVAYARRSGTITVTVGGLPSGGNASIILTPPVGSNIAVTGTTQLANSVPGAWRMNASPVVSGGFTFTPSPSVQDGTLNANGVLPFNVQYTLSSGAIAVAITGLPVGATGAVNITGPNGYARAVTATSTITDLAPGTYTVTSTDVVIAGTTYRPTPASQALVVTSSTIAAPATVAYSPLVSTLVIGVINAPAGASNLVQVTGPNSFARTISNTTTFNDVAPGVYNVSASPAITALGTWSASPGSAQKTLVPGGKDSVGVTYTLASGSMAIAVTGIANGSVVVTGPGGFSKNVPTTQTLVNLTPGTYTVSASDVVLNNVTYNPAPPSQQVVVAASLVASPVTVAYVSQQPHGSASITFSGLPAGVNGQAVLNGPAETINKVTFNINTAQTVNGLPLGTYTLTASDVSSGGIDYVASPASQNLSITLNGNTPAAITYTGAAPGQDDLAVSFAYVTQATQRQDGMVSLVAGRDALLRAFIVNNRANALTPIVRVRIYNGANEIQNVLLDAPESSVRLSIAENVLGSTWNLVIPGANVQPNMRIRVEVDPANTLTELNEVNNVWPTDGPRTISVVNVPAFNVRFIPIAVGGLTGNVTEGNKEDYLKSLRRMFPVRDVASEIGPVFNVAGVPLTSNQPRWSDILYDLRDKRIADGSNAHYYGVVKVQYGSGIAGLGFIGYPAAMGWDHMPSGDGVAAHEWGHNFNHQHTFCNQPGGEDPNFPYPAGNIGRYGWNFADGSLISPSATDIMGYCNNQWISDYTWTKVMNYRASSGLNVVQGAQAARTADGGLMVSGSIEGGSIKLRPAFRVDVAASMTSSAGATHRIEAVDRSGRVILEAPVTAVEVDHLPNQRSFSVVLPWNDRMERSLATIRVRDIRAPIVSASVTSDAAAATVDDNVAPVLPDPAGTVERPRADRARIRFDNNKYRAAMVKDAATGQVIAFIRKSGDEVVVRNGRAVDIVYSDGVRSVTRRNIR